MAYPVNGEQHILENILGTISLALAGRDEFADKRLNFPQ